MALTSFKRTSGPDAHARVPADWSCLSCDFCLDASQSLFERMSIFAALTARHPLLSHEAFSVATPSCKHWS